eukprot:s645_g24.t1
MGEDIQEQEQKKNEAVNRAAAAKEMLKAAGQQVIEPSRHTGRRATERGPRFEKRGDFGTMGRKEEPPEPVSPSAKLTCLTVNRKKSEKKRRATLDPSADGRCLGLSIRGLDLDLDYKDLPKLHFSGYGQACFALRFSPDDLQLAGAYLDGGLRVFDVGKAAADVGNNLHLAPETVQLLVERRGNTCLPEAEACKRSIFEATLTEKISTQSTYDPGKKNKYKIRNSSGKRGQPASDHPGFIWEA